MLNHYSFKNFAYLITTLCGCCLCSCTQKTNSNNQKEFVATTDSVEIWIDQSQLDGTSVHVKSFLLGKALNGAMHVSNDSLKSQYFKKLSFRYLGLQDSIKFKSVNQKAIILSKKANDSAALGSIYWDLASFYKKSNIQDSAFFYFSKAQETFERIDNQFLSGRLLYQMGRLQSDIGDYIGSETTTTRAIQKFKSLAKFKQLYSCYNLLADNAKLLNEPDRAIENYNKSFTYLKKAELDILIEQSWKNNLALVYQKQGQHKKAITLFKETLAFDNIRKKNPRLYGRALNNLAYSYLNIDELDQVQNILHTAHEVQDSINDIAGKSSGALKLAEFYLKQKDSLSAVAKLKVARNLSIETASSNQLLNVLEMLQRADPINAATYFNEYIKLNDSLQLEERRIRNKFALIQFRTDEFIAENQLLERQKQLWTGIAAALLLLGLSTFIIVNQRIKNQKLRVKEEQQIKNQEVFNLMLAQSENVEEGKKLEQKRVSEELHDGVLGKMLGARMVLLGLNKKIDQESVAERAKAIAIIQEIEGEVRSISHELSHAAYQKIHNFILTIKDLIETVKGSSQINFKFNYSEELDWDALNGDIKINLYRIIQESIQNSVKHASCENIYLNFGADESTLTITIKDDGKGFKKKKGKKGIGMRNIASRIEKLNGTWDIISDLGKGTKITIALPLVSNDTKYASNISPQKNNLQEI